MKNLLKLLVLTFALSAMAACGGSNDNESNQENNPQTPDNGTGTTDSGNTGSVNPDPEQADSALPGISGSVNGTRYQYLGDMRFTTHGDKRSLNAVNLADDAESWSIALLDPAIGTYECEPDSTVITLARGITMLDTNADTGNCSITITSSDSIGLEGVFTATLVDANDDTQFEATDGVFKVVFEDSILDLDHDGISDAEDNCPFDANPDQLDDDQNRVGNICEA